MADKDTVTKEYMQDNEVFADAFNYYMYDGRQVIKPEELHPLDTTAIALPFGDSTKEQPVQKYRDLIKYLAAMADENAAYVIYGTELQSKIHFAMPVRNMLYDSIQYSNQVEKTAKMHRKNKDKADTSDEFLGGFYRDDKLIPVITLVIYFGAEEWDAPKSIYDMLNVKDPEILKYVQDYRLNLIAPASIPDEDFSKFHTELSQAFKYLKYSSDKDKLKKIVDGDQSFKCISRKTADMINIVTGSELEFDKGKDEVNMCKAIEGIKEDARLEGKIEGKIEGARENSLETAKKAIALGKMTFEEIADIFNLSLAEVKELASKI